MNRNFIKKNVYFWYMQVFDRKIIFVLNMY